MASDNYYNSSHTIDDWVDIISKDFKNIPLTKIVFDVTSILDITSEIEVNKILEASLIYFGKSIGIETFDDACIKLGISNKLPIIEGIDGEIINKFLAEYKLVTIIKALNEGWYPNWDDENEYKWVNYFKMKGGFSCWYTSYCSTVTGTTVPSALCLKSENLAFYAHQKFLTLYEEYYK